MFSTSLYWMWHFITFFICLHLKEGLKQKCLFISRNCEISCILTKLSFLAEIVRTFLFSRFSLFSRKLLRKALHNNYFKPPRTFVPVLNIFSGKKLSKKANIFAKTLWRKIQYLSENFSQKPVFSPKSAKNSCHQTIFTKWSFCFTCFWQI